MIINRVVGLTLNSDKDGSAICPPTIANIAIEAYTYSSINRDRAFGCLRDTHIASTIVTLSLVSHKILRLYVDYYENSVYADIKILTTPYGKILKSLVDNHVPIRISLNSFGDVNSSNIVTSMSINSIDIVYDWE